MSDETERLLREAADRKGATLTFEYYWPSWEARLSELRLWWSWNHRSTRITRLFEASGRGRWHFLCSALSLRRGRAMTLNYAPVPEEQLNE